MAKISLSGEEKSIESILNWYEDQLEALKDLRRKIIDVIIYSKKTVVVNDKFTEFTLNEINEYFDISEEELEHLVCFDIISATEALLRVNYNSRILKKDRSNITKEFREIDRKKGKWVSLEDDIVEAWKRHSGERIFSEFLGILKYRHWLAHGRYWTAKFGRIYSIDDAYEMSDKILEIISA